MQFKPYAAPYAISEMEQFYLNQCALKNFSNNRMNSSIAYDHNPTKILLGLLTSYGLNLDKALELQYLYGNGKVNGVVRQILTEDIRRRNQESSGVSKDFLNIIFLSNAVDQTVKYLEEKGYTFDSTLQRLATYTKPVKALTKIHNPELTSTYIIISENDYFDTRRALAGYLINRMKPEVDSFAMELIAAYDMADETRFDRLIAEHEAATKQFEASKNDTINRLFLRPKLRIKNQLEEEIRHHKNRIQDLENAIVGASKGLFDARQKLAGFQIEGLTEEEKEQSKLLMDTLNKSPIVKSYEIYSQGSEAQIRMNCVAPLKFYDKEFLARHRAREERSDALDILDEVANHLPGSKIQLIAELRLDLVRFSVGADHPNSQDNKNLYQPHLVYHNCFGDNARNIRDLLRDGKISEAVVNALACMSSINFLDSTVFHKFKRDLTCDRKYLLLKDGTYIGAKEILKLRAERLAKIEE